MTKNMGSTDRALRGILGAVFILALVLGWTSGWFAWVLAAIGVIFIVTSLISVCPLYKPFGITTGGSK